MKINESAGWIAIFNGKKCEIGKDEAKDLWGAKQLAIKKLGVPKSRVGELAIDVAFEDGEDGVSNAQFESLKEEKDIEVKDIEKMTELEPGDEVEVTKEMDDVFDTSLEMAKEFDEEPKLETFDEQMDFLAKDEQEAIDGYEKVLALVDDEHVKEQLQHILEEEIAHKEFLEAVKEDKTLVYSHEEKEEEPVDELPVEAEVIDDVFVDESLNEDDYDEDDYLYDGVHLKFKRDFNTLPDAEENFDSIDDAIAYGKAHPDFEPDCVFVTYKDEDEVVYEFDKDESLKEDTVKQGNHWVNKGDEGTHGKFKTKKEADAQRKAMFANGYHEDYDDDFGFNHILDEEHEDEIVDWNNLDEECEVEEEKHVCEKCGKEVCECDKLEEEQAHTGHIKAKKPIELLARVEK